MPRKTTDIRLADQAEEQVLRLSPLDLALMLASQARADRADLLVQVAFLRATLTNVTQENEMFKLADKYRQLKQITEQAVTSAKLEAEGAKKTHNDLAAQLAQKYGVDWAAVAYNEDSGVITPAPKE